MEKLGLAFAVSFSLVFTVFCIAWVTVLPTVGLMHLLGMLK